MPAGKLGPPTTDELVKLWNRHREAGPAPAVGDALAARCQDLEKRAEAAARELADADDLYGVALEKIAKLSARAEAAEKQLTELGLLYQICGDSSWWKPDWRKRLAAIDEAVKCAGCSRRFGIGATKTWVDGLPYHRACLSNEHRDPSDQQQTSEDGQVGDKKGEEVS